MSTRKIVGPTVQMDDDELKAIVQGLGLSTGTASAPAGVISQQQVALASGSIPDSDMPQTVNFFVLDGSDSMDPYRQIVVDSYNQYFVASMKAAGEAEMIQVATSVFTDNRYPGSLHNILTDRYNDKDPDFREPLLVVHAAMPLEIVPELTLADFNIPLYKSNTPLLDAIRSQRLAATAYVRTLQQKYGKTVKAILTILTDGEENASESETEESCYQETRILREKGNYIPVYIAFGSSEYAVTKSLKYALKIGYPAGNITGFTTNGDVYLVNVKTRVPYKMPDDPNMPKVDKIKWVMRRMFGTLSEQTVGTSRLVSSDDPFFNPVP